MSGDPGILLYIILFITEDVEDDLTDLIRLIETDLLPGLHLIAYEILSIMLCLVY